MKTRNIILKSLCMATLLFVTIQCQKTSIEEEVLLTEPVQSQTIANSMQLPLFNGLPVRHRFATPLEDLHPLESIEDVKALYASFKTGTQNSSKTTNTEDLPSEEAIYQAAKNVQAEFPYQTVLGDKFLSYIENTVNWEMIQEDFPTLTEAQLQEYIHTLERYYSTNLDYLVLKMLAENPTTDDNKNSTQLRTVSELEIYRYTMGVAALYGYGYIRPSIAYTWAGGEATDSSENRYSTLEAGNTRRDAYRHILWNALLAQRYWTVIPSKSIRLNFAQLVTDAREDISPGAADSSEMDIHNNAIGRTIWDNNTGYKRFLGIITGLDFADVTYLKKIIYEAVEENSCFIVKDDENLEDGFQYDIEETKEKILEIDDNIVVYFIGPIAPRQYITTFTYDYSGCKDGANPDEIQRTLNGGGTVGEIDLDPCIKKIYTTTVVEACFVSKDPNFNPY